MTINIPQFVNVPIVNKDGMLTSTGLLMFTQLFSQLGQNFSENGLVLPPSDEKTTEKLSKTGNGSMLYDSATHEPKININGVVKTIQTV
jgi:hypothetical protein